MDIFLLTFVVTAVLNLLGFAWAYKHQSDHSTDGLYSMSFLVVTWLVVWLEQNFSFQALVLTFLVSVWAFRLGIYLFTRIKKTKRDKRFDAMRHRFWPFFGFWWLQIVTVWLVLLPVILFLTQGKVVLSAFFYSGVCVWLLGFGLETVADFQKSKFKSNPINQGQFMQTGVWSWVRYPHYTGEILCWSGIFLSVASSLIGFEWFVVISPLWITFLLVFVSGIPLLEVSQLERYGKLKAFQIYKQSTKKLIPMIW